MKKSTAIEEFDNLYDLPGGCNILAAGKNTPIWQPDKQTNTTQYYNIQAGHSKAPFILLQDTHLQVEAAAYDHPI